MWSTILKPKHILIWAARNIIKWSRCHFFNFSILFYLMIQSPSSIISNSSFRWLISILSILTPEFFQLFNAILAASIKFVVFQKSIGPPPRQYKTPKYCLGILGKMEWVQMSKFTLHQFQCSKNPRLGTKQPHADVCSVPFATVIARLISSKNR